MGDMFWIHFGTAFYLSLVSFIFWERSWVAFQSSTASNSREEILPLCSAETPPAVLQQLWGPCTGQTWA